MRSINKKNNNIMFLILPAIIIVILLGSLLPASFKYIAIIVIVAILHTIITSVWVMLSNYRNKNNCYINKINELEKEFIIEKSPSGITIINLQGIITYVNPSIRDLFNSTNLLGQNIFDLDIIKETCLYNSINNALKGQTSTHSSINYISQMTDVFLCFNAYIFPNYSANKIQNIMIITQNVTKETMLSKRVQENFLSTIATLASIVDARDFYTGKHSKNVSDYVSLMCDKLNLDENDKQEIVISANIHDIGKIGISDSILNKPDHLTNEEYDIMKSHASIGANLLRKLDGFDNVSKIIRHHHERWDGKGYPDKLVGVEIPFGSQIIAIADTYDAITSDRVYRKSLGHEKAIEIILSEKNKQFNPELVDTFIDIFNEE